MILSKKKKICLILQIAQEILCVTTIHDFDRPEEKKETGKKCKR